MKQWTTARENRADMILNDKGTSLGRLPGSALLIHISYGGEAEGGRSILVKVDKVEIYDDSLHFDFTGSRIKIHFDAEPQKRLGGAFNDFGPNEEIEIEGLTLYGDGHWVGIFWAKGEQYEMRDANLSVKIV